MVNFIQKIIWKIRKRFEKEKRIVPFMEPFTVTEITFPAMRQNVTGSLSRTIKLMNTGKSYIEEYMGEGWDLYFQIKGIKNFDASIEQERDMDSFFGIKNLAEIEFLTPFSEVKKMQKEGAQ